MHSHFKKVAITTSLILSLNFNSISQIIIDPCFISIEKLGRFYGSNDLQNTCLRCPFIETASDLVEWNGQEWVGRLEHSNIDLPPPFGCNVRAVWMGAKEWTFNGEAIALRLDKPLQVGVTYNYRFTYASNGMLSDGNFSPIIYTNSSSAIQNAFKVGRLPEADTWKTETITFTAQQQQAGHTWIILHAVESSGFILSDCILENPLNYHLEFLKSDTTICAGDSLRLQLPIGQFTYEWSTGETSSFIYAKNETQYTVQIKYYQCTSYDTLNLYLRDCRTWLSMPNYFSPNGDKYNQLFLPEEYNFIISGNLMILNRWGGILYQGDLFHGWNGTTNGEDTPAGVYFYLINYTNEVGKTFQQKGIVTLGR